MGTFTDDIGVWNELGTVYPRLFEWEKFPVTAVGGNSLLRVRFESDNFSAIRSYGWLRARVNTGGTNQITRAIRLYPKQEIMIVEFPIPQDLQDRSVFFREFELQQVVRLPRRAITIRDEFWLAKLEELWG